MPCFHWRTAQRKAPKYRFRFACHGCETNFFWLNEWINCLRSHFHCANCPTNCNSLPGLLPVTFPFLSKLVVTGCRCPLLASSQFVEFTENKQLTEKMMAAECEQVKVAVRVRPFNKRGELPHHLLPEFMQKLSFVPRQWFV